MRRISRSGRAVNGGISGSFSGPVRVKETPHQQQRQQQGQQQRKQHKYRPRGAAGYHILVSSDLAVVKIIDFGTAQLTGDICEDSKAVGSRWWSPPEQVSKGLYSAMAADMFSVGALLFTLLSGELFCRTEEDYRKVIVRFDRQPSETYWNRITDEAKDLIRSLLKKDPAKRLTCEEVLSHPWCTVEAGGDGLGSSGRSSSGLGSSGRSSSGLGTPFPGVFFRLCFTLLRIPRIAGALKKKSHLLITLGVSVVLLSPSTMLGFYRSSGKAASTLSVGFIRMSVDAISSLAYQVVVQELGNSLAQLRHL